MAEKDEDQKVDLSQDDAIKVVISDALTEQDVVKFTVHTKTSLAAFAKPEFEVIREHKEFVWLHDRLEENDAYAGLIIPPCPQKPDFSQSHGKLAKLQAGDPDVALEDMEKLKQAISGEYLASFQKTVAQHEVFLARVVSNRMMRDDENVKVFLEFQKDIGVKSRSNADKALGFLKSMTDSFDSSFANFKDFDEYFEAEKFFIVHYNAVLKEAKSKAETKVKQHLALVSVLDKLSSSLIYLGNTQTAQPTLSDVLRRSGDVIGKVVMIEKKLANKEDLKLCDLLRYYVAEGAATKDLLVRRVKAYEGREQARKKLEQGKDKSRKELQAADVNAQERFERIQKSAKSELALFKQRRLIAFRKNIIQYATYQIKQAQEQHVAWKELLATLKATTK